MTHFISENEKLIIHLTELLNKHKEDDRPLWKILKEQEKCDVQSIPEIEVCIKGELHFRFGSNMHPLIGRNAFSS